MKTRRIEALRALEERVILRYARFKQHGAEYEREEEGEEVLWYTLAIPYPTTA